MESHTAESGERQYLTPNGPAPSVTTILSTLPNPGLDEWRERVGEEEAKRVSKEATTIGSYMHDMLESSLKKEDFQRDGSDLEKMAAKMFRAINLYGLRYLDEVWGIEVPLHYEDLYAGRTDLVGVFKGKPSIIDYKTTKFFKHPDHIKNYKRQIALYSMAHEWMFPDSKFEQGVLLFASRPNENFNKTAHCQVVVIDRKEMKDFRIEAIEILLGYYEERDESKIGMMEGLLNIAES